MPAPLPRLLHVAQPTTAGVARCVVDLARAQAAAGWDVHVACPPGGTLTDELRGTGVQVHSWPAGRSPGPATALEVRRLAAVVRRVRPGLVHLHSAKAGLAGRLLLRGRVPTVFQPHAWSFEAAGGLLRRATTGWERAAVRWTSLLVCVSEAERRDGQRAGVVVQPTAVVPNGVDVEALQPAGADERARARQLLGQAPGPLVVCVGRLARQKGQDVLLAAWPEVLRQVPGARLVLVGAGPDDDVLRRAAGPGTSFAGAERRRQQLAGSGRRRGCPLAVGGHGAGAAGGDGAGPVGRRERRHRRAGVAARRRGRRRPP